MHSLLTKREKEIFSLLTLNKSTKQIASELCISEKTVRNHISNVNSKAWCGISYTSSFGN